MTLFNRDPNESSNLEELRKWVAELQSLLAVQRKLNQVLREQNELLYRTCEQQDELNDQYRERGKLLKERIAQHETGAAHSHLLRQN